LEGETVDDEHELTTARLTQLQIGSQENPIPFSQGNYWMLKKALMKHLNYAYIHGKLEWPKRFSTYQRNTMPLLTRAVLRTDTLVRVFFRIAHRHFRRNWTEPRFTIEVTLLSSDIRIR
jgi:hypothetical protein